MGKRRVTRRSVHDAHRPNGNAAHGPAMAMLRKLCATVAHDVRRSASARGSRRAGGRAAARRPPASTVDRSVYDQ